MSNAVTVFQDQSAGEMELAPEFHALANTDMGSDLSGGVGGNYAIVSMKGGKWRIKHQGNETLVTLPNGDPQMSIEAVIIKSNKYLTKQYFEGSYAEGDSAPPVCFSMDGVSPSPQVENPVHSKCATCPKNAFGSRITDNGSKAKACQDNRKLAIVPLHDLKNEAMGGPMLLRVPPSALKDLAKFGDIMKARGYPYNAVAVRIGFDTEVSHPKPTFRAIRPLNSEEASTVIELYNSDLVERVLADFGAAAAHPADVVPPADDAFEEPQVPAEKQAAPPPAVKAAVKPATPKAPPAAAKPVVKAVTAATATPAPPAARKAAAKPAPVAPVEPEVVDVPAEETAAQPEGLDAEISNILEGLNAIA